MNSGKLPGHQVRGAADLLADTTETLAGLIGAARCGGLDTAAALASLTAARHLAADLELGELALIEAARDSGATWSQVAAAMGARNRQTAQKRHAGLSRRYPRPPSVDTAPPQTPCPPEDRHHDGHLHRAKATSTCGDAGPAPRAALAAPSATGGKPQATPKITARIIGESRYELIKAPDHAESRAWHVLAGGQRAGLVRPTWQRAEPARLGGGRQRRDGTARDRNRQGHRRRQRPHPRRRRGQPTPRAARATAGRAQAEGRAVTMSTLRGHQPSRDGKMIANPTEFRAKGLLTP